MTVAAGKIRIPAWEMALFGLLIAVHLVPVWAFPLFPSQDGSIHLNLARTLMDLDNPALPILGEYFEDTLDWDRQPFVPLVLMTLFKVFPMITAEKVFLSLIVALFPLSVAYASLALRRDTLGPAFFSFPFVFSAFIYGGAYANFYSVAAFFVTVGYWLRIMGAFTPARTVILLFLFLLTYEIHIFSGFQLLIFIGLGTMWRLVGEIRRAPVGETMAARLFGAFRREGLAPFVAALPVLAIILIWMGQEGTRPVEGLVQLGRLVDLLVMLPLISFSSSDHYFAAAFMAAMLTPALAGIRERKAFSGLRHGAGSMLLFITGFYILSFPIVPSRVGLEANTHIRQAYYVYFAFILWLATLPIEIKVVRVYVAAVAVAAVVFVGYRLPHHARFNDYLAEYLSVLDQVRPNSTLLPLNVAHVVDENGVRLAGALNPFHNAGAHELARRGVVILRHIAAGLRYHSLTYRPERNPYRYISQGIERIPPRGVSLAYPAGNGGRVDYVMLWGPLDDVADEAQVRRVLDQLAADYDLIAVSEKRGLARLYHRKGD